MECKVRDITMTYEEVGTGKPLLALDGWGYSGRLTMMMHAPVLDGRPGWRCLYPELPGHGKTPIPDWLQTPDDMLDVLLEFMEAVAPGERFVVTGASWGAFLALGLLHRRFSQMDGVMLDIAQRVGLLTIYRQDMWCGVTRTSPLPSNPARSGWNTSWSCKPATWLRTCVP